MMSRVAENGRGRQRSHCQSDVMGETPNWLLLALKMEGAMSQGIWAAYGS